MRLIILLILLVCFRVQAQKHKAGNFPPLKTPLQIEVPRIETKIKIDGKLNESDWKNAKIINDFFRREPRQGDEIINKTTVYFLYDDKNLYIGAFCQDTLGIKGIRVQDLKRDFNWGENDFFGIALDPQNLKQYAQGFQTTPYGNQKDFQNFNGNFSDSGWNTLWNVRTKRTSKGYTVEFAIPFKSLRYNLPKDKNTIEIGVTLVRYSRKYVEESTFPAIPQSFSPYRMTYAAKLTGIKAPPPSLNIRAEPYMLYKFNKQKIGTSTENESDNLKTGIDAKWVIDPKTILDVTVNTDFAQADVDLAVNNLERFNIFFPERRQFFLENSGIWSGSSQQSIQPFFSRRIGLKGAFNAASVPIEFGTRFTQRTEKQTLAGLFVRQSGTDNFAPSNFSVARYLRNYGKENNIGLMITHRIDEQNQTDEENHNTTITIDGRIRPESTWDIQYLLSSSIDQTSGKTGYAGRIFAGKSTNDYYYGWVTEYIDDKYDPKMGFIKQSNIVSHNPGGYYIWRPKGIDWIRRWDPGIFINYNHDATKFSKFQQASIYIFPVYVWFRDNSFVEFSSTPTWQNINFDFAPLGLQIEQDDYFYNRYLLRYNTDQSRKLSGTMSHSFGGFYNGNRNTTKVSTRFAPIPHISFSLNYEHNELKKVGVDKRNLSTNLYSGNLRLALNPRVQLSSFYQYNSFNKQGSMNIRFSWEYSPLSFIYLVFNDVRTESLNPVEQNQQFITKISFLKQF